MPSSDPAGRPAPPDLPPRGWSRGLLWGVVAVNTALGLGLLLVAGDQLAAPAGDRAWSVPVSLVVAVGAVAWVVVGAVGFFCNYLRAPAWDPARALLCDTEEGRAVVLPWRTVFQIQPLALSAVVVVVLVGLASALGADGNAGWWLPAAAALPVLVLWPDALARARRSGRVVMSPRGIGVTGGDGDAWLDWDDVRGIAVTDLGRWTVLRVVGVDRASSWRFRPRRAVVHVSAPAGPWIEIPGPAVPVDPGALIHAIAHYCHDASARAELATEQGRRRVAGLG